MRRTILALATLALMGGTSLAPRPAEAGQGAIPEARLVQWYGYGAPAWQQDDRWERRRAWREWRQAQDEARIAEAARREAWRIEQEREQRRAWRHAQREQWQGGGYYRNW